MWFAGLQQPVPDVSAHPVRRFRVDPGEGLGAQGAPGSEGAGRIAACKARVAEIARRHPNAVVLDFMRASPITREPLNYWDPMHYRDAIAERIEAHLSRAARGDPGPSEDYAILSR